MAKLKPAVVPNNQPVTWETWYPLLCNDPEQYGFVRVPLRIRQLPCGCRQISATIALQIFRGRDDKLFKCNMTGCGKQLH